MNSRSPADERRRGEQMARAVHGIVNGDPAAAEAIAMAMLAHGPDLAALHLLILARSDRGDFAGASLALHEALAIDPEHPQTLANAGMLAARQGRLDDAVAHFRRVLEIDPGELTALSWLGAHLQQCCDLAGAQRLFLACTSAHPEHAASWCNLGGVLIAQGQLEAAEIAYTRAVDVQPTWSGGHQGLVWLFTTRGDEPKRRTAIRTWAAAFPGHPVPAHLAQALGDSPAAARCSPEFIASYFDDFARDYDRVLSQLQTNVAATLASMWSDARITAGPVLDLGCGTGSASGWLFAEGRRVVGVDLSPRMLEQAARRGGHAELHCADAMTFLATTAERFDAIVLADVLPYFGELESLFAAIAARLAPGGHVLVSFETSAQAGGTLAPTGRYQHDVDSVQRAAHAADLEVLQVRAVELRLERGKPIAGACAVLRRRATG